MLLGSGAAVNPFWAKLAKALLTSTMTATRYIVDLSIGPRTQEGLQRISEANLKHGRQTRDKLTAQRHAEKVGRRVRGELKRIERPAD